MPSKLCYWAPVTVEESLSAGQIIQVPEEELSVVASTDSYVILIDLDF